MDLALIRTALLISLSILLVLVLWRRFRQEVKTRSVPVPSHLELLQLEVEYHPSRLRVLVLVPSRQTLTTILLDAEHRAMHQFPEEEFTKGEHRVQLELPALDDGLYHLQLDTGTQRTVRQFRLRST